MDSLVESLYVAKADVAELMSIQTPREPWEIPCRWTQKFAEEGLVISTSRRAGAKPIETSRAVLAAMKRIKEDGKLDTSLLKSLQYYLGRQANGMTFETREHPLAVECFTLDTASLLWETAGYRLSDSATFGVKIRRGAHLPFIGLREADPAFIYDYLSAPRGYVEFETRDLLDRIRAWCYKHMPSEIDLDVILRQLSIIKLSNKPTYVYNLEQKLVNYTPITFEDASLAQLMYTDDNLQSIRDQWFSTKKAPERYRDLYDAMVPTYIDHDQFMDMFPARPADISKFTYGLEKQIANGIEKFILFFQARQRYLKRKRV